VEGGTIGPERIKGCAVVCGANTLNDRLYDTSEKMYRQTLPDWERKREHERLVTPLGIAYF